MSRDGTTLRWGTHELIGQRVTDQAGRVGRLAAVLEHVARGTGRVVRVEAHLRPVDGTGWEWTAAVDGLAPVGDGGGNDPGDGAPPGCTAVEGVRHGRRLL